MSSERLEARIQSLFTRYRRDAVLLYRLYPPHEGPRGNSKFGGLPRLPDRYEWPRAPQGVPFHFFAQIDCSEIPFRTPLPDRGVLFFFGRDDDHLWGDGPAGDDCRVIHALDASAATPPREAPPDLPPIGGLWGHPVWGHYRPEGVTGPAVHVEWPVRPLRIDTWPDLSAVPPDPEFGQPSWNPVAGHWEVGREGYSLEAFHDRYMEVLAERSNAAFAAASGEERSFAAVGFDEENMAIAASLLFDARGDSGLWPDRWIHVHYFARAVLHRPDRFLYAENAGEIGAAGEAWLERSLAQPLADEIAGEDRRAFQKWVVSLRSPLDTRPLSSSAAIVVVAAAGAAIRAWAGDPALAALIPPNVYAAMAGKFGGADFWGADYAQMLGHAPSAQEARPPDDPTLCLLNLSSQDGIGWTFGDAGYLTFWISSQDLAGLDFDKVWGAIEGH